MAVVTAGGATGEDSVSRGQYLELGREKLRLEGELRKVQGEVYETKADAHKATERADNADELLKAHRSQLARQQAEFQNYRRRAERERGLLLDSSWLGLMALRFNNLNEGAFSSARSGR